MMNLVIKNQVIIIKKKKNPSLQFQHVSNYMWLSFIKHISQSFKMNLLSKKISDKLAAENDNNNDEKNENENEDEIIKNYHGKKIIDTILEETEFDIICESDEKDDEKKDEIKNEDDEKHEKAIKKMRIDVFDTILSFNSK
eukprot:274280_1